MEGILISGFRPGKKPECLWLSGIFDSTVFGFGRETWCLSEFFSVKDYLLTSKRRPLYVSIEARSHALVDTELETRSFMVS